MNSNIVNGNQLVLLCGDDPGDVFLKLIVVFRLDEVLPTFDSEHDVEINLRIGICHESKMPLLTELENLFPFGPTKMPRLRRSMRTICSERGAIVRFIFNRCDSMESGHFQNESLATTTRAKFYCC
jgi:hypothetical protein